MSDSIERSALPPAADPFVRPRAAGAHGAAGEPLAQQAAAMAVLLGPAAVPNSPAAAATAQASAAVSRARYAVLVSRGAGAAGQALAALARSVRTTLQVEESGSLGEAGSDGGAAGGTSEAVDTGAASAYASAPGWLVQGLHGADGGLAMRVVDPPGAARAAQAKPRSPAAAPDPSRPPVLASTAAIQRVRAPQRLQRDVPPRYWSMLRIVSWGVALAASITLASAYWLIAMYPPDDRERAPLNEAERASQEP